MNNHTDHLSKILAEPTPTTIRCRSVALPEHGDVILLSAGGHRILLSTLGARLIAWRTDDGAEIVVGPRTLAELGQDKASMGAVIGRVANRIRNAQFLMPGGRHIQLSANEGCHHLHGGPQGFATRVWDLGECSATLTSAVAILHLHSAAGDAGYPGALEVWARYELFATGQLALELSYIVHGSATVVNLTHHPYWNLSGEATIAKHTLQSQAGSYLGTDTSLLPTGEILAVDGTSADFMQARALGNQAYDLYLILPYLKRETTLQLHALLRCSQSRRTLKVEADSPGFQLYSGTFLAAPFHPFQGVAIEPSGYIDAPNQTRFPSIFLAPDTKRYQRYLYSLSIT